MGKKKWIAVLLALFFGWIGCQKFYLKNYLSGSIFVVVFLSVAMLPNNLSFFLFGILEMYSFVEGVTYLITGLIDYVKNKMNHKTLSKSLKNKSRKKLKASHSEKNGSKRKKTKIKKNITSISPKNEFVEKEIVNDEIEINKYLIDVINETVQESSLSKENKVEIKDSIQEKNLIEIEGIMDVTDTPIVPIKQPQIKDEGKNWLSYLEIPYERQAMKNEQIKKETLNLYCSLCQFTNEELRKNNKTLPQVFTECLEKNGYYNNLAYTFYCIAEGHVTAYYSKNENFYDNSFSYDLLEKILGKKVKEKVRFRAIELEENFTSKDRFGHQIFEVKITNHSFDFFWWDQDEKIRSRNKFTPLEIFLIQQTGYRDTKIWELFRVKEEIVKLYLTLWKHILDDSNQNFDWKKTSKQTVDNLRDLTNHTSERSIRFINALLKMAENTVRHSLPKASYTLNLNMEDEKHSINLFLPYEVQAKIDNILEDYPNTVSSETRKKLIDELYISPAKNSNVIAEIILLSTKTNNWKNKLVEIQNENDYTKALRILLKTEIENDLELITCFELAKKEKLTLPLSKRIENIIYKDNIDLFKLMIAKKDLLTIKIIDSVLELKKQLRKKVTLDLEQIKTSKIELNETIDILKEFVEENDELQEIEKNRNIDLEVDKVNEDYSTQALKLISKILETDMVSLSDVKEIAISEDKMPLLFIKEINQEFYEELNDQLISVEDDYVLIDSDYIEYAKEILDNEK